MQAENILTVRSDLVRRDSGIPGLALLLDPDRLITGLKSSLDVSQVESISLNYLRYKPGMNCLARYELQVGGHSITAHAKALGEDAANKISKSMERPVTDGTLGPGRVILEDQQIIFSTFPNDLKLSSLQCLGDASFRQRLFGRVFGPESPWQSSSLGQALNYKPERRYVVRLTRPDGESALAKFYSGSGYARAREISRKLTVNRQNFYPEAIGRSKKYNVVTYQWQPGKTLRQLTTDGDLSMSDIRATAGSLAEFHASGCSSLSLPGRDEQAGRLNALADQLGVLLPHLEHQAKSMVDRLTGWLQKQSPEAQPIHGDFYDKQVVVDNGSVSLIDLDAACLGTPLTDLGSYVAHMERLAVNHGISAADVEMHKETLVGAYEQLTNSICKDQLDKYIAMNLFVLIHHPFRDWAQDWPTQTRRLLERVESLYGS